MPQRNNGIFFVVYCLCPFFVVYLLANCVYKKQARSIYVVGQA